MKVYKKYRKGRKRGGQRYHTKRKVKKRKRRVKKKSRLLLGNPHQYSKKVMGKVIENPLYNSKSDKLVALKKYPKSDYYSEPQPKVLAGRNKIYLVPKSGGYPTNFGDEDINLGEIHNTLENIGVGKKYRVKMTHALLDAQKKVEQDSFREKEGRAFADDMIKKLKKSNTINIIDHGIR